MKPTIVHIIDSLGRGGAETMLLGLLPELNKKYQVVLVTLSDKNDFGEAATQCYKKYELNFRGWKDLFSAVKKLKQIIRKEAPILVRTDLFISSIIGRMASPAAIPLVFAVHSMLGLDGFQKSKMALLLEKWVYKKRHTIVAVSGAVLADYKNHVGIKGAHHILNNFVDSAFFDEQYRFTPHKQIGKLRLVAVGNLKEAKNYNFLLDAISRVKNICAVEVDIIGEGDLRPLLQQKINDAQLPVKLQGKQEEIYRRLGQYDAYIMCSLHEGFGNGAAEAMAIGLPLILNDTDTMKEMSKGNALFFKSNDVDGLATILTDICMDKLPVYHLSEAGRRITVENYSREVHFASLAKIYDTAVQQAGAGN